MMFRLKASLTHLTISLLVALLSYYVVFHVWHPTPLAKAVGVTSIFLMMLIIDSILGPLLTLVVAKEGKKSLKFDLVFIAALQLSALIYGLYNIAISRPVWIAFDIKNFEVVQNNNLTIKKVDEVKPEYKKSPWFGPKYVAVEPPKTDKEKSDRIFSELKTGISPAMQPKYYIPLKQVWNEIDKASRPLKELNSFNEEASVDKALEDFPSANSWIPLKAFEEPMVVLVNTKQKKVVAIVDLRPWK